MTGYEAKTQAETFEGKVKASLYALINMNGYFSNVTIENTDNISLGKIIQELGIPDNTIGIDEDSEVEEGTTLYLIALPFEEDEEYRDIDSIYYQEEVWNYMLAKTYQYHPLYHAIYR
jgi:hypothetical protein